MDGALSGLMGWMGFFIVGRCPTQGDGALSGLLAIMSIRQIKKIMFRQMTEQKKYSAQRHRVHRVTQRNSCSFVAKKKKLVN